MNKIGKLIIGTLCALALVISTSVYAGDNPESWTLTLSGIGNTVVKGDVGTAVGVDLNVGLTGHLLLPFERGIRQSVTYDGQSSTLLTTKIYSDWTLFTVQNIDVFVGGNAGLVYGNTSPFWMAAPEVGARWWVKEDVAVLGRVEVPFDLTHGKYTDSLQYFLGFVVKF